MVTELEQFLLHKFVWPSISYGLPFRDLTTQACLIEIVIKRN